MNFKEEYAARLRRLVDVFDDSVRVEVDNDWEYADFGDERVTLLTVQAYPDEGYVTREYRGTYAHEDLMNDLFRVEL